MTEMKFFFYGSFSNGSVHFNKIKEFLIQTKPAEIRGSAYLLKVGFPVVLENGSDFIKGEYVTLKCSDILLNILHTFHGFISYEVEKSLYYFKDTTAYTIDGPQPCYTYFLNPKKLPKSARLIKDGNWQEEAQKEPSLVSKLTEKQRNYISKLGIATGREIVPIQDLSLYRELMKLELIVDKGRRLALSKLGHEVFRFLE